MIAKLLILIILLTSNALAQTGELILSIEENEFNLTGQTHLIVSEKSRSFTTRIGPKPHIFWLGIDLYSAPIRSNTMLRFGYSLNWQLTNYLANESSLGLGYLDSKRHDTSSLTDFGKGLIGIQDFLRLKIGQDTRLELGGAVVGNLNSYKTRWDNAKCEISFRHILVSTETEKWLINLKTSSKIYSPDGYFFVQKRDLASFRTGPQFSGKFGQITLFGGTEIEKFDNQPQKKILIAGINSRLNISANNTIQLRFGASGDTVNKTDSRVISGIWEKPGYDLEIYGMLREGEIWQKEKNIGAKFTLRLPNTARENQPTFSPEEYREPIKKSEFYAESGFQDDQGLTLEQQANRLHTLQLRNEWSGQNLSWQTLGAPIQLTIDTYNRREGDCDDQAILNAWIDWRNGYRAYLLSYYPIGSNAGHGVEIVQDPRTGRWFLDEYGVLQEIRVASNAPLETVAQEALRQGAAFTALSPQNGSEVWYWVYEPTDRPNYYWSEGRPIVNFQSTAGSRPRIEKGYELFAGPDALWK